MSQLVRSTTEGSHLQIRLEQPSSSWYSGLSHIKEKLFESIRKVGEVIRHFFQGAEESHTIASIPRDVLEQMASYLPEEDRINCGSLPVTHTSVALLCAMRDVALRPLRQFCTNPQIRPAWKALYGQELPTSKELEEMPAKRLRELLSKYQQYIKTMVAWLEFEQGNTLYVNSRRDLYVWNLVPAGQVTADILMSRPDQLVPLLEAAKLLNVAQAGGWNQLCRNQTGDRIISVGCRCNSEGCASEAVFYLNHPPYTKENLLSAGKLSIDSLNTGQPLWITDLLTFPPELTTDQKVRVLHIMISDLYFLPVEIKNMREVEVIHLTECFKLASLPDTIGELTSLKELFIDSSSPIQSLPLSMATSPNFRLSKLILPRHMQPKRNLSQGKLTQTEYVIQELKAKGCDVTYV